MKKTAVFLALAIGVMGAAGAASAQPLPLAPDAPGARHYVRPGPVPGEFRRDRQARERHYQREYRRDRYGDRYDRDQRRYYGQRTYYGPGYY